MSLNNDSAQPSLIDVASRGNNGAIPSPPGPRTSGLRTNVMTTKDDIPERPPSAQNAFLAVPSQPVDRRPSLESAYSLSDLSELSYHPSSQHEPLMRTDSNASQSAPRSPIMQKLHSIWVTNYGALLVLVAQLFGCLMNLSTRLLETPGEHGAAMHPFQILFARQGITAAVCITYGLYTKKIPYFPFGPKAVRWLLVLRGLGGFFGVFGLYFSLLYLPLSEATVMTFLGPILTCYVCSIALTGETFTRHQQLAAFVSLAGVVLIARPLTLLKLFTSGTEDGASARNENMSPSNSTMLGDDPHSGSPPTPTPSQHLTAIGISLIGVLGGTCAMTSIRAIGTRAHPFISINYFSVWCTIVSLACLIIFPDVKFRLPGNWTEWGLLASLGANGFVMQWLLTEGLAYGSASNSKAIDDGEHASDVETNGGRKATTSGTPTTSSSKNRVVKGAGTRATSMVYTQMLFALAGDKIVFGVIPNALSWLGSGLILAGAVWVAAARDQPGDASADDNNSDADRRRTSLAGGGMELNTVAANAVGFGPVSARSVRYGEDGRDADGSKREGEEEMVGLMGDVDGLDDIDDDAEASATPSSSSSAESSSRGPS